MSRIQVPITVIDAEGNAVAGATVTLTRRTDGAAAVVYLTETTPTAEATNVVTTDSLGRVNAWVEAGAYLAAISGTGIGSYGQAFDAASATPSPSSKPNGFSLGGALVVPANNTTDPFVAPGFFIEPVADERVFLWKIRYKLHAGTAAVFKIQRNGVDVTGWTALSASTGGGSNTLAAMLECFAGDYIQLLITGGLTGTPSGLAATVTTLHYPGA